MARPIWKGHIAFGLVSVPVVLYGAERRNDIHFTLMDSENAARIRYERINEATGEEVPWNRIVKGYEYKDDNYVLLSDEELERADVELARTIEIDSFVAPEEIDPVYYDKPYYLAPQEGGEKAYVLLREALRQANKVGLALVVIRTRQYPAALFVRDSAIVLNVMRFHQELRDPAELDIPARDLRKYHVTSKEIDLAKELIDGMTAQFDPASYRDEYREALLALIERKVRSGTVAPAEPEEEPDEEAAAETIVNFMDVLRESLQRAGRKTPPRSRARRRPSTGRRRNVS